MKSWYSLYAWNNKTWYLFCLFLFLFGNYQEHYQFEKEGGEHYQLPRKYAYDNEKNMLIAFSYIFEIPYLHLKYCQC